MLNLKKLRFHIFGAKLVISVVIKYYQKNLAIFKFLVLLINNIND